MAGELSDVLRSIVGAAAKAPVGTNEELARMRKRYQNCSNEIVVLADCSGSMSDLIGSAGIRKIEHLRIALTDLLQAHPNAVIIAFGSYPKRLKSIADLPDWMRLMGGTELAAGMEMAAALRPKRTIIISDGLPSSKEDALAMVDQLTGRIDCVYCGPDGNPAIDFLHSLARRGGGDQMTFDGCKELSPMIRGLLGPG